MPVKSLSFRRSCMHKEAASGDTGESGWRRRVCAGRPPAVRGRAVHDWRSADGLREEGHGTHRVQEDHRPATWRSRAGIRRQGRSITQILPPDTPSGKFRVELEIVEALHRLVRTDSLATIETEGLVGGNYLGITTGSDTAPIVAANATIAGKEPLDIAELVQQMGDTVTKVNDVVDDMRDDVQPSWPSPTPSTTRTAHHRRDRRGDEDRGVRCADHRRCRADRRGDSQRQRHDRQTRQRRRAYNRVSAIAKQTEETTHTRGSWSRVRKRPSRACSRRMVQSRG